MSLPHKQLKLGSLHSYAGWNIWGQMHWNSSQLSTDTNGRNSQSRRERERRRERRRGKKRRKTYSLNTEWHEWTAATGRTQSLCSFSSRVPSFSCPFSFVHSLPLSLLLHQLPLPCEGRLGMGGAETATCSWIAVQYENPRELLLSHHSYLSDSKIRDEMIQFTVQMK